MEIIKITAIIVVAMLLSIIVKEYRPEFRVLIQISTAIIIFFIISNQLFEIIDVIENLLNEVPDGVMYSQILFKSLGVCILTQLASDTCKDAGEQALSSKIELAGKITIISFTIPLFKSALEIVTAIIGGT